MVDFDTLQDFAFERGISGSSVLLPLHTLFNLPGLNLYRIFRQNPQKASFGK
jgi:hypothetical protein